MFPDGAISFLNLIQGFDQLVGVGPVEGCVGNTYYGPYRPDRLQTFQVLEKVYPFLREIAGERFTPQVSDSITDDHRRIRIKLLSPSQDTERKILDVKFE